MNRIVKRVDIKTTARGLDLILTYESGETVTAAKGGSVDKDLHLMIARAKEAARAADLTVYYDHGAPYSVYTVRVFFSASGKAIEV